MADESNPEIRKVVKPKGNILNDTDNGVDYIGHSVYAEALAEKIDHVRTPITIGIFARWGSGKSFLLNHIKNLLDRRQRQNRANLTHSSSKIKMTWQCTCLVQVLLFLISFCIIVVCSIWAAHPALFVTILSHPTHTIADVSVKSQASDVNILSVTDVNETSLATTTLPAQSYADHFSRYIALSILLFYIVLVGIVVCGNNEWWATGAMKNLRLIFFVAFTKLPIKSFEKPVVQEIVDFDVMMARDVGSEPEVTSNKKYIFVNFNAWEYAGSDTLWAGIITTLSNAIEAEFGTVTARLCRMLKVSKITDVVKKVKNAIYVKFPEVENAGIVRSSMTQYGVVVECAPLSQQKKSEIPINKKLNDWWKVEFANKKGAETAFESLSGLGIKVLKANPCCSAHPNNVPFQVVMETQNATEHNRSWETTTFIEHPSSSVLSDSDVESCSADVTSKPHSCLWHFMRHPKTLCGVPNIYWYILAVLSLLSLPIITYTLADMLDLDVYRTGRAVPIIVQIVSWLPAVGAASFVLIRFVWAMFHSQRSRIHSALSGAKANMANQLGFMNKVKTEVEYITKLLQCAEYSHRHQYRVIISIDDLDRCALDKIKSVLEAVSILLSDPSSAFVCLIAIDSRVAVKCIEDTMGASLIKNNMNGHEYLKKIINLPFCLPEIHNDMKRHFIDGLMDLADETSKKVVRKVRSDAPVSNFPQPAVSNPEEREIVRNGDVSAGTDSTSGADHTRRRSTLPANFHAADVNNSPSRTPLMAHPDNFDDVTDGLPIPVTSSEGKLPPTTSEENQDTASITSNHLSPPACTPSAPTAPLNHTASSPPPSSEEERILSTSEFLFECREFLCRNKMIQRHLEGNPRNIKRIFNVVSLTSWIMHCYERKKKRYEFLRTNSTLPPSTNTDPHSSLFKFEPIKLVKTKQLAADLVVWVVLIDQWPYRMSYLLEVWDDMHERPSTEPEDDADHNDCLIDVYEKCVLPEMDAIQSKSEDGGLLSLDIHPDMFASFLKEIKKERLLQTDVEQLKGVTISLDHSIRQTVVGQREAYMRTARDKKRRSSNKGSTGNSLERGDILSTTLATHS